MRARPAVVDPERAQDPDAAREASLKLLERTRRTRSDLARRLRERGYAGSVIDTVLERLTAVGLIDDVEYARAFLAGRWGRRPAGWRKLELDLKAKGIGGEDIAAARRLVEEQQGVGDEVGAARKVVEQASRRLAALDPRKRRQRLWALLSRRGFAGETIEAALSAPAVEAEETAGAED
jgi:regulatory protein